MGYETTVPDSIDTLSLHMALVGLACFFGYLIQKGICLIEAALTSDAFSDDHGGLKKPSLGESIPLFPLCMVGGMLLDRLLRSLNLSCLIDPFCMQRVSGLALDYLITAVLATMRLSAVMSFPFASIVFVVLNVIGFGWHFFCILYLAPRMLPDCWFERAIFEVGHSMGTTANGLILLKMVDPLSETAAPSAISYKLVIHEPLMGFWVAMVVFALKQAKPDSQKEVLLCAFASGALLVFWLAVHWFYFRHKFAEKCSGGGTLKSREEFLSKREEDHLEDSGDEEDFHEKVKIALVGGEDHSSLVQGRRMSAKDQLILETSGLHGRTSVTGEQTDLGHMSALSSRLLREKRENSRAASFAGSSRGASFTENGAKGNYYGSTK